MGSWNRLLKRRKLLRLDGWDMDLVQLEGLCAQHAGEPFYDLLALLIDPDPTMEVMTSGSTGKPKTILLSKDKMLASANLTIEALQLQPGACLGHCISPKFIGGIMQLVRALVLNAEVLPLPVQANPILGLRQKRVDLIALVPYQVQAILRDEYSRNKLASIKNTIIGGAPLDPLVELELETFPNAVYATFGMTETLSHIALRRLSQPAQDHFECLGPTTISADKTGQLVVHASHLHDKPLHTKDVVEVLDERRFRWLGRTDNVINSGGVKLHPETLERKIAPRMESRFYFTSQPDANLSQALVLMVEGPKRQIDVNDLLEKFERPRRTYFVDRFTEAANGKVLRLAPNHLPS